MLGNVRVTRKQERFLQALLIGESITSAAKLAGVTEQTGHRWLKEPHILAERERRETEIREKEQAEIERILTTGYAAIHERVKALGRVAREIEASYHKPGTEEIIYQWMTPEKIREWRGCLEDISSELGQRVKTTKQEVSGALDVSGAKDSLFNKIAAFAAKSNDEPTQP